LGKTFIHSSAVTHLRYF